MKPLLNVESCYKASVQVFEVLATREGKCGKYSILLNSRTVQTLKFNTTSLFYRISFDTRLKCQIIIFCFVLLLEQMHGRPFGTGNVFLAGRWYFMTNMHVCSLSAFPGIA